MCWFAFLSFIHMETQAVHLCQPGRLPASFHSCPLSPFLVDPFSLLWLSQLRKYCPRNPPALLPCLAYCFTGPLARTSGWLIICTFSTSFSKLREARCVVSCFSRNLVSLVIQWCQRPISSFNVFLVGLFLSRAIWSPWNLGGMFGLNIRWNSSLEPIHPLVGAKLHCQLVCWVCKVHHTQG